MHKMQFGAVWPYRSLQPSLDPSVFVAPDAQIIGDVSLGPHSSVWYGVVLRGDIHYIRIGTMSNIQDGTIIHVTRDTHPTVVGDCVTVGHRAVLHGCTVHDYTLIGIGAVVLDGAVVEERAMVAAGALVTPGTRVPSGALYGGVPARQLRALTQAEMDDFSGSAERYRRYADDSAASLRSAGL